MVNFARLRNAGRRALDSVDVGPGLAASQTRKVSALNFAIDLTHDPHIIVIAVAS
jgi:hypothetical protein